MKTLTNEPVPNHLKHWWFALGGTPAILFSIQIVTGIFLLFYYVPTPEQAYQSVSKITDEAAERFYMHFLPQVRIACEDKIRRGGEVATAAKQVLAELDSILSRDDINGF